MVSDISDVGHFKCPTSEKYTPKTLDTQERFNLSYILNSIRKTIHLCVRIIINAG